MKKAADWCLQISQVRKLPPWSKSGCLSWEVARGGRGFATALAVAQWSASLCKPAIILCETLRKQEELFNDLRVWMPEAEFLPALELGSVRNAIPDPEIAAERLHVLRRLAEGLIPCTVAAVSSMEEEMPTARALTEGRMEIKPGMTLELRALVQRLEAAGFQRGERVSMRGAYAVRGGILDLHTADLTNPLRIEFFGDEIESLRLFDIDSQRTIQPLPSISLQLNVGGQRVRGLAEFVDSKAWWITAGDIANVPARLRFSSDAFTSPFPSVEGFASGGFLPGELVHSEASRKVLNAQLMEWKQSGWQVAVCCTNEAEHHRLAELLASGLDKVEVIEGSLAHGFVIPDWKLAVLADSELLGRNQSPRARRLSQETARRTMVPIDVASLSEGDLVVHLEHGIARYAGVSELEPDKESLELEFAASARLFVPMEQCHVVGRYVGIGKRRPALSELGNGKWARLRASVERSVESFAAKLLSVQAAREVREGFAFSPDTAWQIEFEQLFPYRETPDQLRAIEETKRDMESPRPMDRLICGDVGFGKTEVAIRAAFKAVMDGRQVALLAPTTILAQQHFDTLQERMSEYPVRVGLLSRFLKAREIKATLMDLEQGAIDIVVGTHRLIAPDVRFKSLGLVIIDEEQRFGVKHKERLKSRFELVDQLTLSATPIPRTLYLSLLGAKDMSTIETPPPNRYPVETVVCAFDERVIREACEREIRRGGQVYYLHNRVATIEKTAERLRTLLPQARVIVGHGQMEEELLEVVMHAFVSGKADILVATTIIESGLDIPNANTIIIDRADRFGLADLYQLRGRVGRAQHKAYAYLLLPRDMVLAGAARKRVNAIEQYSTLGAGFRVAMRDLEIRGAGNILGTEQSGHVISVGFDLYCQLLRDAVARARGEKKERTADVIVRIDFLCTSEGDFLSRDPGTALPAYLPHRFVPTPVERMQLYRRVAEVTTERMVEELSEEMRDRFGPLPKMVAHLLELARLRVLAAAKAITIIDVKEARVALTRNGDLLLIGNKFPRLTSIQPTHKFAELLTFIRNL